MSLPCKKELRNLYIKKREIISDELVSSHSLKIYQTLLNNDYFKNATTIFTYVSIKKEVDTKRIIIKAMSEGKKVLVPRCLENGELEAVEIKSFEKDLRKGYFELLEPLSTLNAENTDIIDLALVPGLVFDVNGYRIGFGKGFYDRFLPKLNSKCKKIGLAYDFQIIDTIPKDSYDQSVNLIITEDRILKS